jgi:Holliday junction resolvase
MGKASQRKGRGGELELVRIFQAHGIQAEPGKAASYGETPDVVAVPGIHCEVKRVERLNVHAALAQAVRDSEKFGDGVPVVFHRRNRQEWLCTMRLEDFLQFYQEANG